jgi:EmrB/QacA subfamily drug resistance transporter
MHRRIHVTDLGPDAMATPAAPEVPASGQENAARRRDLALAIIVASQLMVMIDGSIVNIALVRIQRGLHFSPSALAWVVSAYSLALGGLLLTGGRAGDMFGRRRMFIAGLTVFTGASLLAGLSPDPGLLIAARAAQGAGAALAAPASLSLLAATFAEGPERRRALGAFSMATGLGLTLGLILGGLLTAVSWRWIFIINVPIGAAAIGLARPLLAEIPRHPTRFDLAGAASSVLGASAVVYGFIHAASSGWRSAVTLAAFAVGVVALAAFALTERRAERPILPLALLADQMRAAAYAGMLLLPAALAGTMFFCSIFAQDVLRFSPLRTGLAFLPLAVFQFACARAAPRLVPRLGPRRLAAAGAMLMLAGGIWLTQLSAASTYPAALLGPLILWGAGVGLVFMPLNMVILAGLPPQDTGSASGLLQCLQQVGAALGVATLTTVFATSLRHSGSTAHAVASAVIVAVALTGAGLVVTVSFLRRRAGPAAQR